MRVTVQIDRHLYKVAHWGEDDCRRTPGDIMAAIVASLARAATWRRRRAGGIAPAPSEQARADDIGPTTVARPGRHPAGVAVTAIPTRRPVAFTMLAPVVPEPCFSRTGAGRRPGRFPVRHWNGERRSGRTETSLQGVGSRKIQPERARYRKMGCTLPGRFRIHVGYGASSPWPDQQARGAIETGSLQGPAFVQIVYHNGNAKPKIRGRSRALPSSSSRYFTS